jgi:hypothetical protein
LSWTRTLGLALTFASAAAPADAALEPGVIGVLPFLDGAPEPGALYDGHIRLELSPNPKLRPFPMLLDTGAAQTVMSPRWASTYAARAGGHVRLDQPGEIVHELSLVNLTEVTDVAISNLTLGEQARATRVFPDG